MGKKSEPTDEELMEENQWDFESAELMRGRHGGGRAQVTISLSSAELGLISDCAERHGKRMPQFIREVMLDFAMRSAVAAG